MALGGMVTEVFVRHIGHLMLSSVHKNHQQDRKEPQIIWIGYFQINCIHVYCVCKDKSIRLCDRVRG